MSGSKQVDAVRTRAPSTRWRTSAERAARRLAALTAAGALVGLMVGGVGGRLAMMLLARLNPDATGVTSDDEFTIGQFTVVSTLNLLVVATVLGVVGAGVYALVRGLRSGPRWFEVLTIAIGPAVVVGALIVHADGVDFRLLKPTWLAIGLFVAIPGVYAATLTLVAEHWLRQERWWAKAPLRLALAPIILWLPAAPLLGLLVAAWLAREALRTTKAGATALDHPAVRWAAQAGLTVIFAAGLLDLGRDTADLI